MNPVYEYLDYRTYFEDYYEDRKGCCPFFSFRYWASKMGTDASNIAKILQKKRHASSPVITAFMKCAGFDRRQQQYFLVLVKFNKTKSEKVRLQLLEKLIAIRNIKTETLLVKQYDFYNKWYHTAVFTLLYYYKFSGGKYRELASQLNPPITVEQAKESVALLEKIGLIYKDAQGVYRHAAELISSGEEWRSIAIQRFQEETIKLALESLRTHPRNIRDISSVSLTIAEDDLKEIQKLTREYRKAVMAIALACDNPDRVYQLNIQFFPMTNVLEKEE